MLNTVNHFSLSGSTTDLYRMGHMKHGGEGQLSMTKNLKGQVREASPGVV